jgi:hypothetical protein
VECSGAQSHYQLKRRANRHIPDTHLLSVCCWWRSQCSPDRTPHAALLPHAPCWFALNDCPRHRCRPTVRWAHVTAASQCLSLCCVCGVSRLVTVYPDRFGSRLPSNLSELVHGYRLSWPNWFTVTVYPDRIGSRLPSNLSELVHGYRLSCPNGFTVTVYPVRTGSRLPSILTELVHGYRLSSPNWFTVAVYPDRTGSWLPSILTELVHSYHLSWPNWFMIVACPDRINFRFKRTAHTVKSAISGIGLSGNLY